MKRRLRHRLPWLALLLLAGCAGPAPRRGHRGPVPMVAAAASVANLPLATDIAGPLAGARPRDDIDRPQDQRYALHHDTGPRRPPADIASLPVPVPHPEPRSRYGNKSPYTVNGHTYHVLKSDRGYDKRGIASWYGEKFHGYLTSSLEPYDMYGFTAASKVLPLPSWVRVTNLANGKSVIVRVNDRGPFVANRLIDLSYAAAVRIGIWPRGTGLVEVRAIDPRHPAEPAPRHAVTAAAGHAPRIWLQVGAFADAGNAARVAAELRHAHLASVQVQSVSMGGHVVRRVRLGPLRDVEQADRISTEVVRLGLPHPRVTVD